MDAVPKTTILLFAVTCTCLAQYSFGYETAMCVWAIGMLAWGMAVGREAGRR